MDEMREMIGELLAHIDRNQFSILWDRINGAPASWASNPWVWVVTFKRTE